MKTLRDINTDFAEGKLLMAAIAIITGSYETNRHPDEVLNEIESLSWEMFNEVD